MEEDDNLASLPGVVRPWSACMRASVAHGAQQLLCPLRTGAGISAAMWIMPGNA